MTDGFIKEGKKYYVEYTEIEKNEAGIEVTRNNVIVKCKCVSNWAGQIIMQVPGYGLKRVDHTRVISPVDKKWWELWK